MEGLCDRGRIPKRFNIRIVRKEKLVIETRLILSLYKLLTFASYEDNIQTADQIPMHINEHVNYLISGIPLK